MRGKRGACEPRPYAPPLSRFDSGLVPEALLTRVRRAYSPPRMRVCVCCVCSCGPGAALTLMRPPACVLCAVCVCVLCVCVRQPPGLVVDTPLASLSLGVCVFPTHTEGGDPGILSFF